MENKMNDVNGLIERLPNKQHRHTAAAYIKERQEVDKVAPNTLKCDMLALNQLSRFLKNKPFQEATKDDMREWSRWMTRNKTQDTTRDLYLMKVKRFYKYISEPENYTNGKADQRDIKYPDSVRWITYQSHDEDDLPLESLLDDKQIKKLLDACADAREQTIIVSLLDGGLRKSELRALKVGNINFDPKLGANFILPKKQKGKGTLKTGTRKVQLFLIPSSTAYIKQYMNHHLFKNDPEAPFIYTMDKSRKMQKLPLTEKGVDEILHRIIKTSGLKMHLTPHILRHNSATRCSAKGFNESMMRERYGWKKNSAMPSRYIHLTQTATDDKIKQILGIKGEETPEVSILQPILCPNCEYENVPTNVICGRCGMKLKISKEDIDLSASSLGVILQKAEHSNPDIKKLLEPIIREEIRRLLMEQDGKK